MPTYLEGESSVLHKPAHVAGREGIASGTKIRAWHPGKKKASREHKFHFSSAKSMYANEQRTSAAA